MIFLFSHWSIKNFVVSLTFDWSDGSDGCGKSLCLSQVVHWAVKSGWTVVHVPSGERKKRLFNIHVYTCVYIHVVLY